jgi:hypothetical protein
MVPVAVAQLDGLLEDELLMAGVAFTTTVVLALDGQFKLLVAYAAVAVTVYDPAMAVVADADTVGFC